MDNPMKKILIFTAGLAASFTSCRIYDPINDGGLLLTTEWSERTDGVAVPDSYHVKLGDYSATHTEATQTINRRFASDTYRLHIWHPAHGITIDGTVATIMDLEEVPQRRSLSGTRENLTGTRQGEEGEFGGLITGNPGWLFTCAMDVDIKGGGAQELIAPMRQQIGELTLIIRPTGENADRIAGISGTLMGAARKLDFDTGQYSSPSDVQFEYEKNADGDWQATARLLGVTGISQLLNVGIFFTDNTPEFIMLDSDLTEELAGFNDNKKTPIVLGAQIVETPTGVGFTSTIESWDRIERGEVIAE
jgi:hypothetical protein